MAKCRVWSSDDETSQAPPPPYEADQIRMEQQSTAPARSQRQRATNSSSINYAHSEEQTIPKTAHSNSNSNLNSKSSERHISTTSMSHITHNERVTHTSSKKSNPKTDYQDFNERSIDDYGERRPRLQRAYQPDTPPGKRSVLPACGGGRRNDNHEQFVRSLAAPKSFWGHVSVEPFAFLAIVALYIEFPAIQDLIWTKICLEVISTSNPTGSYNQTAQQLLSTSNPPLTSNVTAELQFNTSTSTNTRTNTSTSTNTSLWLANDGRIQSWLSNGGNSTPAYLTIPTSTNHGIHDSSIIRRQHLICDRLKRNVPAEIRQRIIDVDSLFWLKYQILICTLCLLASPYWGGLSDKIGRLIPMNVPVICAILCNTISLIFGLLISLDSHTLFHIEWLFAGAIIVGLSGGQMVLIMNMFSFISDNTTNEERSRRVTILESVIFVAHSLGFFLSKTIMLLGLDPPERPWLNRHFVAFGACILLNVLAFLYAMTKLRHHKFHRFLNNFEREQQEAAILGSSSEQLGGGAAASVGSSLSTMGAREARVASVGADLTHTPHHMSSCERLRELTSPTPDDPDGPIARSDKSNWSFRHSMITFRYYRETYEIATKRRDSRAIILLLLLSGFISSLSLAALMSLFFIYVKMDPFNWSTSQYSHWNSISSITRGIALVSLTLMMRFASFWSVPDPLVAAIGFLAKGAGLLTIGLAQSSSHLNWSLLALTFSEYSMPPIRSLLSKLVVREELCKIYSCVGASQSFCFILGNIAFYSALTLYTDQHLFRLSFLVVAGIEFGAVILVLIIYTAIRRQMPHILL